jgi:hypothetical protein
LVKWKKVELNRIGSIQSEKSIKLLENKKYRLLILGKERYLNKMDLIILVWTKY